MHHTRMWVIALCIFLLGGAAGYFAGTAHVLGRMEAGFPPPPPGGRDPLEDVMGMLGERLELSSDQKAAIRPLVRDFLRAMARLHAPVLAEEDALLAAVAARIDAHLTPEQAARHSVMLEERRRHRESFERLLAQ